MIQVQTNDTSDSTYFADELGQYQSLSSTSVAALVLGLLSPLVLITPILIIIPLAACGFALLSLSRISSSEGNLSGAGLAYCGLALALVFGIASFTRNALRDSLYQEQLTSAIEPWLESVSQAQFDEAKQHMTLRSVEKFAGNLPVLAVVPIYRDKLLVEAFAQDPAITRISDFAQPPNSVLAEDLSFSLLAYTLDEKGASYTQAKCLCQLQNLRDQKLALRVELVRSANSEPPFAWLVDSWEMVRQ